MKFRGVLAKLAGTPLLFYSRRLRHWRVQNIGMWIRERLENPPQISDLSTWRKVVIVVAIAFALTIAFVGFDKDMEIQATAPNHPVPAQGRVFPVDVNHGYIRYVTWEEKQSFLLWAGQAGSWAGAAAMMPFSSYSPLHES